MQPLNKVIEIKGQLYKRCNKCKEILSLDSFNKASNVKSGHRGECKYCQLKYLENVRHKYKYDADAEYFKKIRKLYGISKDRYLYLREQQKERCAICGRHETEFNRRLHIDHDHDSGEVRGLLCVNCNKLLGYSNDDINLLLDCIDYLQGLR